MVCRPFSKGRKADPKPDDPKKTGDFTLGESEPSVSRPFDVLDADSAGAKLDDTLDRVAIDAGGNAAVGPVVDENGPSLCLKPIVKRRRSKS